MAAPSQDRVVASDKCEVDAKRQALEAVLASRAFSNAEQLRRFLRYVCEMDLTGRSGEINEYSIGVEALGRPVDYSPDTDSAVRTRAYSLRRKLHELYEGELQNAPIRIEIPKGSYVPHFVTVPSPVRIDAPLPDTREPVSASPSQPPQPGMILIFAGGFLSATLLATILYVTVMGRQAGIFAVGFLAAAVCAAAILLRPGLRADPRQIPIDEVLVEAWGPLASPDSEVLICLSTRAHLGFRPLFDSTAGEGYLPAPESEEMCRNFVTRHPQWEGAKLFLEYCSDGATPGDAIGAVTAARNLTAMGVPFRAAPTRTIRMPLILSQNTIVFGSPDYSRMAMHTSSRGAFQIHYDAALRQNVIREQPGSGSEIRSYSPQHRDASTATSYGLLTVTPADNGKRTVVISGVSSAGIQGAMEFFASPKALANLKTRFEKDGGLGFPPAYQVVVKCLGEYDLLLSYDYETHRIINLEQ